MCVVIKGMLNVIEGYTRSWIRCKKLSTKLLSGQLGLPHSMQLEYHKWTLMSVMVESNHRRSNLHKLV